jgi:hypothetical protein
MTCRPLATTSTSPPPGGTLLPLARRESSTQHPELCCRYGSSSFSSFSHRGALAPHRRRYLTSSRHGRCLTSSCLYSLRKGYRGPPRRDLHVVRRATCLEHRLAAMAATRSRSGLVLRRGGRRISRQDVEGGGRTLDLASRVNPRHRPLRCGARWLP